MHIRTSPLNMRTSPLNMRTSPFNIRTSPLNMRTSPYNIRTIIYGPVHIIYGPVHIIYGLVRIWSGNLDTADIPMLLSLQWYGFKGEKVSNLKKLLTHILLAGRMQVRNNKKFDN